MNPPILRGQYFIAGTDTDVGKTYSACYLLNAVRNGGGTAIGLKPVAAGAELINGVLVNGDALQLQQASSVQLPYAAINPICLADACSPHIAARRAGVQISAREIVEKINGSLQQTVQVDLQLVEGAGGWLVPINESETMADVAALLGLPVILVVAMKLGCINHALLTKRAIERDGLPFAGWIASGFGEQMPFFDENLHTLTAELGQPLACL